MISYSSSRRSCSVHSLPSVRRVRIPRKPPFVILSDSASVEVAILTVWARRKMDGCFGRPPKAFGPSNRPCLRLLARFWLYLAFCRFPFPLFAGLEIAPTPSDTGPDGPPPAEEDPARAPSPPVCRMLLSPSSDSEEGVRGLRGPEKGSSAPSGESAAKLRSFGSDSPHSSSFTHGRSLTRFNRSTSTPYEAVYSRFQTIAHTHPQKKAAVPYLGRLPYWG